MKLNDILVFCDGAASGNPGPAGWGAILLLPDESIVELGGGSSHATNNQMELTAAIESLKKLLSTTGSITIATDSKYVISGATEWVSGWKKRDWKTSQGGDVINRPLWEELDELLHEPRFVRKVSWIYVAGHSGIPGNERTDEIAVLFSRGETPVLFKGRVSSYRFSEDELRNTSVRKTAPAKRSKLPALHYLSYVDGILQRHKTWPECEARVKGRVGAKFKKVTTPEEEGQILADWGVTFS